MKVATIFARVKYIFRKNPESSKLISHTIRSLVMTTSVSEESENVFNVNFINLNKTFKFGVTLPLLLVLMMMMMMIKTHCCSH